MNHWVKTIFCNKTVVSQHILSSPFCSFLPQNSVFSRGLKHSLAPVWRVSRLGKFLGSRIFKILHQNASNFVSKSNPQNQNPFSVQNPNFKIQDLISILFIQSRFFKIQNPQATHVYLNVLNSKGDHTEAKGGSLSVKNSRWTQFE